MRACKLCTFFARLLLLAEGGGCVFGANGGLLAPIHVEFPASEITHWADEAEMRKRMKGVLLLVMCQLPACFTIACYHLEFM
uniref:Secreted protein n=1 Tax=Parascaris equorum TaxID=6256 RepID=A0A914RPB9_PAREQ